MNEQIIISLIYILSIFVFQIITTPKMSLLSYKQALGKNKPWVLNNQGILETFKAPKNTLSYIIGFTLISLAIFALVQSEFKLIKIYCHISIVVLLVQSFIIDRSYAKKIKTNIPEPDIKSASLVSRNIFTYLSKPHVIFATALLGINLVTWVIAFTTQTDGLTKSFISDLISTIILLVTFTLTLAYTIKRAPLKGNKAKSEYYRVTEIRVLYYSILFFLIRGLYLSVSYFYKPFNGWEFMNDFHNITFVAIPLVTFMFFNLDRKINELTNESFTASN